VSRGEDSAAAELWKWQEERVREREREW